MTGEGHDPHEHHPHDDHPHDDHAHDHPGHAHSGGLSGALREILVPHTHDAADSIDDALEADAAGIRAVKVSLVVLLATTVLQAVIVVLSGSIALFADTVHNLSDALTAVPLWVAFALARRRPSLRYSFGLGRAEDLAGLFIILVIALSAVVAAWQSIERLLNPQPVGYLGWVIAAGIVGFAGNETVAIYRIRVGRRIGSAALVADGTHARTDGFTSLAVVLGALGVLLGFPLADPIVGLLISAAILVLLVGTLRSIGRRLMDGIEPELIGTAEHALLQVDGIRSVQQLRLRWVGHRLQGDAMVVVDDMPLRAAAALSDEARASVVRHLPRVDVLRLEAVTTDSSPS